MSDNNKQAWLILSHGFNMDGRAASQTITDKIPHLLKLGVEPVVVSAITGKKDKVIEHHQVLPAGPVALRFDLRHYLKQRISSRFIYRIAMTAISLVLLPFILIEKLFIRIETHWSWAITAYFTGANIIKTRKPALVYSTGGAYAAHLAGYWLARKFGLPWIAEIHDPMVFPGLTKSRMRMRFSAWLEGVICKHADVVWWFTEEALARARARHPELGERGHCLIPGSNPPEFVREPYRRSKHLVIGHFGSLAETRNLEIFLQGLRRVLEKNPQWSDDIRLHLYGGGIDPVSARALKDFPHPFMIEQFGRLETDPKTGESGRDRVLKRMNAADCLLLLHGTVPFCEEYIPSKMYEYLWTHRPILALVHHNPQMSGILHALGHWAVAADNSEEVAKALEDLHARWTQDNLADSNQSSPYSTYNAVQSIYSWTQHLLAHQTLSDSTNMPLLVLRTKYAFHALLWLLDPDVILDVGSMDGSDSKRFKKLMPKAEVIAFEGNPNNYRSMCADVDLQQLGIRICHRLVSNQEGSRSFFVQRSISACTRFNKGTSSTIRRSQQDMETEEVRLDAVRIDSFLTQEYSNSKRVAIWIDVEGHAYEVLEGLREVQDRVYLIHVEVETQEIWSGQRVESDILALAKSMGFILVARGAHEVQRDLILIRESWYNANRSKIVALLYISKWVGPLLSKRLRSRRQT